MTACMHGKDCRKPARWQVGFKFWAWGHPKKDRNSCKALTSLLVCDDCSKELNVQDYLLPAGRERIASSMRALGKAIPDFDGAELALEEIVGEPVDVAAFARQRGVHIG